jgi:putative ABC transport system permease protein
MNRLLQRLLQFLSQLWRRLLSLLRRVRYEREMEEEMRFHLEMQIEQNLAAGMAAEEAHYAARRQFGNQTWLKEVSREMWSLNSIETLIQDLRYGARMLMKKPGSTLIAVITLGLGIGANTAIFSVVNAVLLRPLPYADDGQLVLIWGKLPAAGIKRLYVSVPEFIDYRERTKAFTQVGVYGRTDFTLTGKYEAERLIGANVSPNLLSLLGVQPRLGRHFLDEEEKENRAGVVMLSHSLWQRRFSSDPKLIGQAITLNDKSYEVIGIMPPSFQFPSDETEIWRPLVISADNSSVENQRDSRGLSAVARMKPGVSPRQAQADLDALASNLRREYPKYYGENSGWGINLVPLRNELAGDVRDTLPILLVVVGCVLLIACANVANLLLARATTRQREMAVRAALGAGRWRLIRQLLTESILLALVGGGLGILLAWCSNDYLIKVGPKELSSGGPVGIDGRVLLFTSLVSLLTAVLFGLAPAWQASKLNLNEALKEGGRGAPAGRGRLRNLLVIGELAVTLTLLVGAGLVLKSFYRLLQVDPGFDPANVLTMRLALSPAQYPEGNQQRAFFEQVLSKIETLPGIQAAGAIQNLPMSGDRRTIYFSIEGQPEPSLQIDFYPASPHYFKTMGMRLANGRFFTPNDREDQPRVAIVNEALAHRFFPNQDPLGKRIKIGKLSMPFPWLSIVGVVRDVKQEGLNEETNPALYVPYLQPPLPGWKFQFMFLSVRTQSDPLSLIATLRSTVQAVDKDQPIYRVATMEQLLARSLAAQKFSMLLLVLFALLALSLSVIGLYSLLSYAATQRTHEIGIRMALGAQTKDVIGLIVKQGAKLTLIGLSVGLSAALALTRLMKSLLFRVEPNDPLTFCVITLLLTIVALLACWIPARRAASMDPLVSLRVE